MAKVLSITAPIEVVRAQSVSKEDVGHTSASTTRNDGYARRSKLKTPKTKNDSITRKTNHGEISGDGDTTEDDDTNGDEEDSSDEKDGDDAEDDDPEVFAPSGGAREGKPNHSRLDSIMGGINMKTANIPSTVSRQTGPTFDIDSTASVLNRKRKRTLSEISGCTVLSTTEHDGDQGGYPRKRVSRRLSNTTDGLLRYDGLQSSDTEGENEFAMDEYEEAIKSSEDDEDEDEEVYTALDQADESQETDVEKLEEMMIIQEETAKLEAD